MAVRKKPDSGKDKKRSPGSGRPERKQAAAGGGRKPSPRGERPARPARPGRPEKAPSFGKGEKKGPSSTSSERTSGTRGGKRFDSRGEGPRFSSDKPEKKSYAKKSYGSDDRKGKSAYGNSDRGYSRGRDGEGEPKKFIKRPYTPRRTESAPSRSNDGLIRLNKFLSNAGIASRRDADELIELGLVTVNGKVTTELGTKVDPTKDVVRYDDKSLKPERFQYVLLNKPKDFITTMEDDKGRKTVMSLVQSACKERIYPVGRLDRNTTGLLLFTNDGDLAKRLTHPKHGFPKLYHVETVEKVNGSHLDAIREGVKLEDGYIKADEISFVNDDPHHVGIRIHSGKNRIVRRIFEHFQYTVKKLDRVMFASLTKRDLARGRFRHLTEQEVNFLKMIR